MIFFKKEMMFYFLKKCVLTKNKCILSLKILQYTDNTINFNRVCI